MAEITTKEFNQYFGRFVTLDIRFYWKDNLAGTQLLEDKSKRITLKHNDENNVRIAFNVEKYPNANNKGAGIAHIMVYNLDNNTMELINKDDKTIVKKIRLTAGNGSEKNEQLIFDGTINTSYVRYVDTDLIQHFWCFTYDSKKETSKSVEKNYLNQTLASVLNDYLPQVNLKLDTTQLSSNAKTIMNTNKIAGIFLKNAYDLSKKASEILNAKVVIEDGTFKMISLDVDIDNEYLYPKDSFKRVNRSNGLIQSPTVLDVGLELNMILRGDIQMFDKVFVESPYADYNLTSAQFTDVTKKIDARYAYGDYKGFYNKGFAYYVTHQGDTHENLWKTTIRTITNQGFK